MSFRSELAAMKYLSTVKPKEYSFSTRRDRDMRMIGYELKEMVRVGCGEESWKEWRHLHTTFFPSYLKKWKGGKIL